MERRPTLFIGSSGKNLVIANALHRALQNQIEVTVWTQEIFEPSGFPVETLIREIREREFAAFVYGQDDLLVGNADIGEIWTVRDNVLIETGIALGILGRDKVFLIAPRSKQDDLKIPTDLQGMTLLLWDDQRNDGNLRAALDGVAYEMIERMRDSNLDSDWVSSEHHAIANSYITSIANIPTSLKDASIPLSKTALHKWLNQLADLQNDGLVMSHGDDIDITEIMVNDASSYTLVWRSVIDPHDKDTGWAGGWVRFLKRLSDRKGIKRNSIFLLDSDYKENNKDTLSVMAKALEELNFDIFHADLSEVENELSSSIPFSSDFEIIGEEIFKIVRPAGESYRSQEGVHLVLKDLKADHTLHRITRYVFEAAGCK